VCDLVSLGNNVAVVLGFARPAESGPEGVTGDRPGDERARGFVEYRVADIDPLHDLRVADGQVCIRKAPDPNL
jgi:hypothetical protein